MLDENLNSLDKNASDFNDEISDLITITQNLQFDTVIESSNNLNQNNNESSESNTVLDQILFDESDEYDFNFGQRGEKFTSHVALAQQSQVSFPLVEVVGHLA